MTEPQPIIPADGPAAAIAPKAGARIFLAMIGAVLLCLMLQILLPERLLNAAAEVIGPANLFRLLFLLALGVALVALRIATLLRLKRCVRRLLRQFEHARDCGSSWIKEVSSYGYGLLSSITGLREQVRWTVRDYKRAWWTAFWLSLLVGGGLLFAFAHGVLDMPDAAWSLADCVIAAAVAFQTARRIDRSFSSVDPSDADIKAAVDIHIQSVQGQKEEIIAIAKRS